MRVPPLQGKHNPHFGRATFPVGVTFTVGGSPIFISSILIFSLNAILHIHLLDHPQLLIMTYFKLQLFLLNLPQSALVVILVYFKGEVNFAMCPEFILGYRHLEYLGHERDN